MHEIDYKINVNFVYFVNWKGGLPLCLQSRASSTRQLRARLDPHRSSFKILSALKHLNWPHKEFTGQRLNRSPTFINPFIALSASNNFKCKTIYVPLSLSKRIFLEEIQLRANISAGNLLKRIF